MTYLYLIFTVLAILLLFLDSLSVHSICSFILQITVMKQKIDRSSDTEQKNDQAFIVFSDTAQRLYQSTGNISLIIFLPYKGA